MTPKVKIIENVFPDSSTGHWSTYRNQIWWKSAVAKLPKGHADYHTQKTSRYAGLIPAPFSPKFSECCHPLTCPCILNLARISCALLDLFQKDFSAQKVTTI